MACICLWGCVFAFRMQEHVSVRRKDEVQAQTDKLGYLETVLLV